MTNQYIVQFTNNTVTETEPACGFAELFKTNNIPVLNVRTCENKNDRSNQNLLYQFMTNNFAQVSYNDDNLECVLKYFDHVSVIKFDRHSSSAFTEFKKQMETLLNSKYETEYYPSGRVLYVGEVLYLKENDVVVKRQPHGSGVLYYDLPNYKIKYSGEFENGLVDGAGVFYDRTGNLKLKANNISSGVPTQKGKLEVLFKSNQQVVNLNFFTLWDDLNVTDKSRFVISDSFVDRIALYTCKFENMSFDDLCFDDKTVDDKLVDLRKLLVNIRQENDKHYEIMKKSSLHQYDVLMFMMGLIVLNISVNLIF